VRSLEVGFRTVYASNLARSRDVGESDTVLIATDFLADVLGYDKYSEITAEFVIRSTFCDLAIRTNGQLRFLIEVKAIGTDLKENHLRQAADYGANQGADWVLLTNGAELAGLPDSIRAACLPTWFSN
jgi:hypothetical protein